MFDTHVKPKVCQALQDWGISELPASWGASIYEQAAKASAAARKVRGR